MKTHSRGAALQQFASEGEVASSLVLSYTLVPVQEEEGNAPDVSSVVYSPQVGTGTMVPVRGVAKYKGVVLPPHNA